MASAGSCVQGRHGQHSLGRVILQQPIPAFVLSMPVSAWPGQPLAQHVFPSHMEEGLWEGGIICVADSSAALNCIMYVTGSQGGWRLFSSGGMSGRQGGRQPSSS